MQALGVLGLQDRTIMLQRGKKFSEVHISKHPKIRSCHSKGKQAGEQLSCRLISILTYQAFVNNSNSLTAGKISFNVIGDCIRIM